MKRQSSVVVPCGRVRILPDPFVSDLVNARFVRFRIDDAAAGVCISPDEVSALLIGAEFDFASVRLPANETDAIDSFRVGGFYVVETLITYRHDLRDVPASMPESAEWLTKLERSSGEARDVGEIGRTAFKFDRFHSDSNIGSAVADLIKQQWSLSNIAGRAAGSVVVRSDERRIVGFCEIVDSTDCFAIDLIAVHPKWQRRGLARKLMEGALHVLSRRMPAKALRVGTASTNTASRSLYEAVGCEEEKREVTLHWAARKIEP